MKTITILFISFIFLFNANGQMKMNSSSNVGIGTLTPQQLLHVKGGNIILDNGKLGIKNLNPTYELDIDGVIRFNGLNNNTDLIWDRSNSKLLIGSGNPSTGQAEARLHIKSNVHNINALFLQDVSPDNGGIAVAKIMGRRDSDANTSASFSGQFALSRHYGADHVIDGMRLGRILFGGNHTNGTYTNTLYSASIYARAEEDFSSSTDMSTSLYFQTDTAGIAEGTPNDEGHLKTRMIIESSGEVGIGTTSPSYLLEVNGSAAKPGGGSWTSASDKRLKSGVKEFEDGLEQILQINPVLYRYTGEANLPSNQEFVGVIAQDIQKVAPYMVKSFKYKDKEKSTEDQYLGVDDTAIKYMLINAIKEQQAQIEELKEIVENFQGNSNTQTESNLENIHHQDMVLSGKDGTYLGQNVPNPYKHKTTIEYRIPDNTVQAFLVVYDISGSLIKKELIQSSGSGLIHIEALELKPGVYTYSLLVDNQIMATKKMVITN